MSARSLLEIVKALASLALLVALGSAALAQTSYIVSGALTTSDPTFRRPSNLTTQVTTTGSGATAAYDVYAFTVSASGTYVGEMASSDTLDTYLFVYSGSFDPANPLTNLLNGDDDSSPTEAFTVITSSATLTSRRTRIAATGASSNFVPNVGLVLNAGTTYYAVASSFFNSTSANGVGTYSLGIGGGPGNVTAATPVPEPATMVALGLGAVALIRRRRQG